VYLAPQVHGRLPVGIVAILQIDRLAARERFLRIRNGIVGREGVVKGDASEDSMTQAAMNPRSIGLAN
jgi:hypothetical protein